MVNTTITATLILLLCLLALISLPHLRFLLMGTSIGTRWKLGLKDFFERSRTSFDRLRTSAGKVLFLFFCASALNAQQLHIGLCIVATGKYIAFVKPLLDSAEQYFCPQHKRSYFIFTDASEKEIDALLECSYHENIVVAYQKRFGWPHDTLMRFSVYNEHKHLFASTDYMFATDADMLFVGAEGDEILGELVATNHPGFTKNIPLWGSEPPYDRNPLSMAYIPYDQGVYYFAGGFYGGLTCRFIKLVETLTHNIFTDLEKYNYIAAWHDESHLNRYFIDNEPSIILDRSYCYPENGELKGYPVCDAKLLALDKNHAEIRE